MGPGSLPARTGKMAPKCAFDNAHTSHGIIAHSVMLIPLFQGTTCISEANGMVIRARHHDRPRSVRHHALDGATMIAKACATATAILDAFDPLAPVDDATASLQGEPPAPWQVAIALAASRAENRLRYGPHAHRLGHAVPSHRVPCYQQASGNSEVPSPPGNLRLPSHVIRRGYRLRHCPPQTLA